MPVIDEHKYSGAPGYQLVYERESRAPTDPKTYVNIRSTAEPSVHTKMIRLNPEGYTFRTFQGWRAALLCAAGIWIGGCLTFATGILYIPFLALSIVAVGLLIIYKFPKVLSGINTEILVDPKGITTGGVLYPWESIYNTFMVERIIGKTVVPYLVLVTNNQELKYIPIHGGGLSGIYRIATVIDYFRGLAEKK